MGNTLKRRLIFIVWASLLLLLFEVVVEEGMFNAFRGYAAKYGFVFTFSFIVTDFEGPVFMILERQNRKNML